MEISVSVLIPGRFILSVIHSFTVVTSVRQSLALANSLRGWTRRTDSVSGVQELRPERETPVESWEGPKLAVAWTKEGQAGQAGLPGLGPGETDKISGERAPSRIPARTMARGAGRLHRRELVVGMLAC